MELNRGSFVFKIQFWRTGCRLEIIAVKGGGKSCAHAWACIEVTFVSLRNVPEGNSTPSVILLPFNSRASY
jgi:hypothetical protein